MSIHVCPSHVPHMPVTCLSLTCPSLYAHILPHMSVRHVSNAGWSPVTTMPCGHFTIQTILPLTERVYLP